MPQGVAISFEGISNAGKTTAVQHLVTLLNEKTNRKVVIKEDLLAYQGDSIGAMIKRILDRGAPTFRLGYPFTETLLIAAKRAFESQTRLEPALNAGAIIICDRDVDTVTAYQLPVLKDARPLVEDDILIDWIRQTNALASIEPQLTIYLNVSVETSLAREEAKGTPLSLENATQWREHHKPLPSLYEKVLARPIDGRRVIRIDTEHLTIEAVLSQIEELVLQWLRDRAIHI